MIFFQGLELTKIKYFDFFFLNYENNFFFFFLLAGFWKLLLL